MYSAHYALSSPTKHLNQSQEDFQLAVQVLRTMRQLLEIVESEVYVVYRSR